MFGDGDLFDRCYLRGMLLNNHCEYNIHGLRFNIVIIVQCLPLNAKCDGFNLGGKKCCGNDNDCAYSFSASDWICMKQVIISNIKPWLNLYETGNYIQDQNKVLEKNRLCCFLEQTRKCKRDTVGSGYNEPWIKGISGYKEPFLWSRFFQLCVSCTKYGYKEFRL